MSSDALEELRRRTPARIALGRVGNALPTREVLNFSLAHARARDAIHVPFDVEFIDQACHALGFETIRVCSAAADRETYLRRPDLGRRLSSVDVVTLSARNEPCDLVFVIADGLSSPAIHAHAPRLLEAVKPLLDHNKLRIGPLVVARQARVALGDEIGALLQARMVVVFIGERPGLSSPDSLGVYLTLSPRPGRTDAERNCISNVRPGGLDFATAAQRLFWLIDEAFRLGKSGVDLKDMSDLRLAQNLRPALPRSSKK
jgi:ethanolamine ammonia-lyase small subunit